jgi:hypothetical protein
MGCLYLKIEISNCNSSLTGCVARPVFVRAQSRGRAGGKLFVPRPEEALAALLPFFFF